MSRTELTPAPLASSEAPPEPSARDRVAAAALSRGLSLGSIADLCRDADVTIQQGRTILDELRGAGAIADVEYSSQRSQPVHRDALEQAAARIFDALKSMQSDRPNSAGVPRSTLAAALAGFDPTILNAVLDHLIRHGQLAGDERAVSLMAAAAALSPRQVKLRGQVIEAFQQAGATPPQAQALSQHLGAAAAELRRILDLCVAQQQLVHLGSGLFLHAAVEAAMRDRVRAALTASPGGLTLGQLRQLLGTTRKFVLPIAEYLDRVGLTRRQGDRRVKA